MYKAVSMLVLFGEEHESILWLGQTMAIKLIFAAQNKA
jgi:hypothetical protein